VPELPSDDQPGFVAEEPERCHYCYRLIHPGQGDFLTMDEAVVCPDCTRAADAIRLAGGLTVRVGVERQLVRLRWGPGCSRSTQGWDLGLSSVPA
jgi:hypothetical protein